VKTLGVFNIIIFECRQVST